MRGLKQAGASAAPGVEPGAPCPGKRPATVLYSDARGGGGGGRCRATQLYDPSDSGARTAPTVWYVPPKDCQVSNQNHVCPHLTQISETEAMFCDT